MMDKAEKKKYIIISLISLPLIVLITMCAVYFYNRGKFRESLKHNNKEYPITGIDISSHNGDIDFNKVANDSISFIYIKATEGISFIDQSFEKNYLQAIRNNIPVGVYHFFRFDMDGTQQAKHFLSNINSKLFDIPLAIDVEEAGNPSVETDSVVKRLKEFISYTNIDLNKIVIYTNLNGYNRFIKNNFDKCILWICRFEKPSKDLKWQFWQYSHWGEVEGVSGDVDLDVFKGDKTGFQQFVGEYSY